MSRPRPADQPGRLLDAAEELFVEFGPRNTTAADIAKRASVATATLYHYFASKDALLEWVLVRAAHPDAAIPDEPPLDSPGALDAVVWQDLLPIEQHVPKLREAATGRPSFAVDELAEIIAESYDLNVRHRRILDLLQAGIQDDERLAKAYVDRIHQPLYELRRQYLRAGQRAGAFAADLDVGVITEFITTNVGFYARVWRRGFPLLDPDDDRRRDVLVRRLYRAIAA